MQEDAAPSYNSCSLVTEHYRLIENRRKLDSEDLSAMTAYRLRDLRESYSAIKINPGKFRRASAGCRAV